MRVKRVEEARLLTHANVADYEQSDLVGVRSFFAPANPRDGRPAGRMFVVNRGPHGAGYFWCPRCEYAEAAPAEAQLGAVTVNSKHVNPRTGDPCPNETLRNPIDLGHEFETDIRAILIDRAAPAFEKAADHKERERLRQGFLRTLAEAMRMAAAKLLETDPRDLRAAIEIRDERPLIILSDAVAGGAGYSRRLVAEPEFSVARLIGEARNFLDCPREECATSCSRCLNEYSNQQYWDIFDRRPALDWLEALLSSTSARPEHAPNDVIPCPDAHANTLSTRLEGAENVIVVSSELWGASDQDSAVRSARALREFLETNDKRKLYFIIADDEGIPGPLLTTSDREIADIFVTLERKGQIVTLLLNAEIVQKAPRLSISAQQRAAEFFGADHNSPILDGALAGVTHWRRSEASESWLARNMSASQKHAKRIFEDALATMKAFRFRQRQSRDFSELFKSVRDRRVALKLRTHTSARNIEIGNS